MYPINDFAVSGFTEISIPFIITFPAVGAKSPVIIFMVVVLPAPFCPIESEKIAGRNFKRQIINRRKRTE